MNVTIYIALVLLIQTLINFNKNMFNILCIVKSQDIYKSPYKMPDLRLRSYVKEGDIKIGALTVLSEQNAIGMCSDKVNKMAWQNIERIAWPVRQINENTKILPNITLGFVALDYCSKTSNALAASMAFLPTASCADVDNNTQTCFAKNVDNIAPTYDVIGVVVPATSRTNVPISYLYTPAKVPQMGYMSTSDELSNKANHPYYFRVVPPDKYQVEAMLKFVADHDWTYISVIYSQGPYGEKAFDNIKERIDKYGICIATHHRLIGNIDYDAIAANLVEYSRARVVLLFMQSKFSKYLFDAVAKLDYLHHFVWLGSDSWSFNYDTNLENHKLSAIGAFSFFPYEEHVSQYYDHIGNERVNTSTNPFIKTAWEHITDCSFDAGTCDSDKNIALSDKFFFTFALSLYFDAILAFAQAADDLIKEKCPDLIGEDVSQCVKGDMLTQYLKNVSFDGYTGLIEFNEENDAKGKYMIRQIVYGRKNHPYFDKMDSSLGKYLTVKVVGVYDMKTEKITYNKENVISWSHLNTLDRIVPLATGSANDGRPESVCSGPCVEREYKILKELPCCWECRRCRDNERLDVENSTCRECPLFTWPEAQTGYQTCIAISLTFQRVR